MIVRMPTCEGLGDEQLGLLEGAERRVDGPVVGDVVAAVGERGDVPGGDPDRVDTEVAQVREPRAQARQVTGPVAVPVREAARVDLVDHCAAPPLRIGLRLRLRHSRLVSRGPPSMSPGPGCPV